MAVVKLCSIDGCGKPAKGRGWCQKHYAKWRRHGSPFGGLYSNGEGQKWLHDIAYNYSEDNCLIWPYNKNNGYGTLLRDGKTCGAHRMICEMVYGIPPTAKHDAAHSCGERLCCNPIHLRWATRKENEHDKIMHGRTNRGERCGTSKLTLEDIDNIKKLVNEMRQKDISKMYNVHQSTINRIVNGLRWSYPEQMGGSNS